MPVSFSIIDDKLKVGLGLNHKLVLKYSTSNILCAVLDTATRAIVALEKVEFTLGETMSEEINKSILLRLISESSSNTVILIDNPVFTIVPDELFNKDEAKRYLAYTHAFQVNEELGIDNVQGIASQNVFWLPYDLVEIFNGRKPETEYRSFSSILIEHCLKQNYRDAIQVYICSKNIYAVAVREKKMRLCVAYDYSTVEDMVFYTLNIFQRLGFDCDKTPLLISGEDVNVQEFKSVISQYIEKNEYNRRPSSFIYHKEIQDLPEYLYTTFLTTFLCE